jgi:hypothetical protein
LKYKKPHPWYRSRGYLHFDCPISFETAKKIVTSPKNIASHSFYPLINYSVDSKKIKQDKKTGNIETKHKQRPIAYSAHVDSHIYAYYSNLLTGYYEDELVKRSISDSVLAFRSLGKSNIEFAHEAFTKIKEFGSCGVVALDLSKFFDKLDHNILKSQWMSLIGEDTLPADHYTVFKSITKFSQVEKSNLYDLLKISSNNPKNGRVRICEPSEFRKNVRKSGLIKTNRNTYGIPQGSPMSALLSNIYMLDFDERMHCHVNAFGGTYFRYCDDMLFIVPIEMRDKIAGTAREEIKALKVDINTSKTELRTFTLNNGVLKSDRALQYLGFLFDGQNVYLRSASLARYSERMRQGIRLAKATMRKRNKIKMNHGESQKPLFKNKIYRKYSHLGSRNFITYGFRAADIMNSETIKKQLKPLWNKLQSEMK